MNFFKLPDLPYAYNALEPYIDEETMKLHHDKHHAGYTAKLNSAIENDASVNKKSIEEILSSLDDLDEAIRKAVTNNGGGFYNHSVFWEIMATKKDQEPDGELLAALNKSFSSFEKFFQSRRLNIKYRSVEKTELANILNGTAFSTRPIIAILENYQQEDGSVLIPKVLQKYLNKEKISPGK